MNKLATNLRTHSWQNILSDDEVEKIRNPNTKSYCRPAFEKALSLLKCSKCNSMLMKVMYGKFAYSTNLDSSGFGPPKGLHYLLPGDYIWHSISYYENVHNWIVDWLSFFRPGQVLAPGETGKLPNCSEVVMKQALGVGDEYD